jgi:alpha 1,2-mannosyltransferase
VSVGWGRFLSIIIGRWTDSNDPHIRWEDPYGKEREANTVTTVTDKTAPNELGIDWGISPLEIAQWSDDDRLRDLEGRVYDYGFVPNGKGF